jgi:sterol desaturase/sphingolipid hydroxylase (fatty acid hydroxylase superfamily)
VDYIVAAIPVFFALIALEVVLTRVLERKYYRLSDTLADLGCGTVQQLLELGVKTLLFAAYVGTYRYRFYSPPEGQAWTWVVCFLGVDFIYYWFHRLSHEINAFWAAHVVHHQSEEYNLSVALRQGALQGCFAWVFYLPLALLGFPPLMYLTLSSVNTLYQFWIHTRVVGRLGPMELVFNTPSHHRVHHGRNPKYIDRNHGGTLIVWDRLFGTFVEEEEEPVYGITTPLRSWNPVWANVQVWGDLFGLARRTQHLSDAIRLFWKPPGWRPADLGGFQKPPEIDPASPPAKFEPHAPRGLGAYALVQFVPVMVFTAWLLKEAPALPGSVVLVSGLGILVGLASLGALLEGRRWAVPLEVARVGAVATLLGALVGHGAWLLGAPVALGCGLWILSYRGFFVPAVPPPAVVT